MHEYKITYMFTFLPLGPACVVIIFQHNFSYNFLSTQHIALIAIGTMKDKHNN
jgi:hypothetical protein